MKKNDIDMLSGSVGDKTLKFALPLAATGILQQLFNAADIAVVGRFVGKKAMAAVGSNTPIINLIISLFIGISVGANVVIAKYTGQRNDKKVSRAVHTALAVSVISGVILALVCEFFSAAILRRMSIPSNVFALSLKYFRVYLAGLPVILLYDFASAVFRSRGNTRTPLICLFSSGVINVLLNLFFVIVLKLSVIGVALATVMSTFISSAMLVFFLYKDTGAAHFDPKKLCLDGRILNQMVQIGLPAGLQGMVYALSNIIIQASINKLGEDVMAGSAAALNIEVIVYYILSAFGQTCTTFVGQNYGARKPDRCQKILRVTMLQNAVFSVSVSMLILLMGRPLLSMFNPDPDVINYGIVRMRYILLAEIFNVVIEILSGWMRGFGYSLVPALICVAGICGVRITWVYTIFKHKSTFTNLISAYPLSWAITAAALGLAYIYVRYKKLGKFFAEGTEV